jgi:class 3 adenylate cyclase
MANAREIIVAVMQDVQGVAKLNKNTAQGFNFRGIDAVLNAVGPSIRKHGGFIVPEIVDKQAETVLAKNGGALNVVRLTVAYSIMGTEGDGVTGIVASEAFDSGDKATAKAMSVALRTFLIQLLALPTDEPDPDTFTYELGASETLEGKSVDELREMYLKAQSSGADKQTLNKIKDLATQLDGELK